MHRDYVPRMINLERTDYKIVKRMAEERGLGDKGFSAALRKFICESKYFRIPDSIHNGKYVEMYPGLFFGWN